MRLGVPAWPPEGSLSATALHTGAPFLLEDAEKDPRVNPEVRLHGTVATVWTPYDFWIDGKFSHCGIDAFDLVKTASGWKIAGVVFTVEPKCEPSPLGPLKQ